MSTLDLRVKCPSGTCNRTFTIRLKLQLRGKKILIECPGCFGKFKLSVPLSPKREAERATNETLTSETTIEVVLREIFDIDLKSTAKRN